MELLAHASQELPAVHEQTVAAIKKSGPGIADACAPPGGEAGLRLLQRGTGCLWKSLGGDGPGAAPLRMPWQGYACQSFVMAQFVCGSFFWSCSSADAVGRSPVVSGAAGSPASGGG